MFQELQEIATWSLSETSLFCSDASYVDREPLISAANVEKAKTMGYMEQHGVLRTNCIDCLDRFYCLCQMILAYNYSIETETL